MGTAGEIIVLIKFSPKRERILGAINENIEVSSGDNDVFEKVTTLSKLSVLMYGDTHCSDAYKNQIKTLIYFKILYTVF